MSGDASPLKSRIQEEMKDTLRKGDRRRLSVIRLILAAVKQREIDDQVELDDAGVVGVLQKMTKQRRDSIEQYRAAQREDLADQEVYEVEVIAGYLPEALDESAVAEAIDAAIAETGATSMRDMGKVMGLLKGRLEGRADMGRVSAAVKTRLAS
ncbi:MAG: GatB/YqeY domain-containing protein [Gammaproteobacteria bacterium]|nr:GatB/YqeY domain-containing protein [Gammaproteobacteria bacterium]